MRLKKRCPPPPPRADHPEPDVNLLSPENAALLARNKARQEASNARSEVAKGGNQKRKARKVDIGGRKYDLEAEDALALFGALALAVDGETASITLASGEKLEMTHREVSDLGRQLAGKPADEVSGRDRGT